MATAPKRTPATIEFLRGEAAKLSSAASDPAEQTVFLTDYAAADSAKRKHCDTFLTEPPAEKHRRLSYNRPAKGTKSKGELRSINWDIETLISSKG